MYKVIFNNYIIISHKGGTIMLKDNIKTIRKSKGLSQKEIQLIKDAYPNHELPAQYVAFLEVAGKEFIPWQGSDYCIFDSNGYYDLANTIKRSSYLTELFKFIYLQIKKNCI